MNYFRSADILLPVECDYRKWAVIACDQFTSQPEYWCDVDEFVGNAPSTYRMFFPEAQLASVTKEMLTGYCDTMTRYLETDCLVVYPDSYVYVERTLQNGMIRQGVVGMVDLEYYDYEPKADTKIFATEATVLERVPPRVALREKASLEFSHTVMFCDNRQCHIIDSVAAIRDELPLLYDFDLMFGGGHIKGYLLQGSHAQHFEALIHDYERLNPYLVGDGNHSLVTAKLAYEAKKKQQPGTDWTNHPARYAMVELENIHSPSMLFEPIYRIAVSTEPDALIRELQQLDTPDGTPVVWIHKGKEGTVRLCHAVHELPIEALQRFLDHRCSEHGDAIDYIHGADTVRQLAQASETVGFLLPDMDKGVLFPYILAGKVMPRKTFSTGQALEKRYYLEGRKIK